MPRTYKSLCAQSCKNFIWLIIDDGSQDHTEEMIRQWQLADNGFEIQYIYQENGGMHTAHNRAYANICTELNVCVDSDDCMAEDAVEKIFSKWQQVKGKGYAGIIGLDADMEGNVIGKRFPQNLEETTLSGYYAAGGQGDKKLIYRTDVIKSYPEYPAFEGEKYVALAYKYRLIDQDYKMAVLDDVLCNVDYQPDGSSNTMWKQYMANPKGFAFWRKVCMQYPESKKRLFVDCIHYVAESLLAGNNHFLKDAPKKCVTVMAVLPGIVLKWYIQWKVKRGSLEP